MDDDMFDSISADDAPGIVRRNSGADGACRVTWYPMAAGHDA